MSDIRQAKQNTQLAGAFDDISHLGDSKQAGWEYGSSTNPPSKTQAARKQAFKSKANERQKIKPTVTQPGLNPTYTSIQSESNPDPPPDQSCKYQDARYLLLHPTYIISMGPSSAKL